MLVEVVVAKLGACWSCVVVWKYHDSAPTSTSAIPISSNGTRVKPFIPMETLAVALPFP